jgi:hypothetical protein
LRLGLLLGKHEAAEIWAALKNYKGTLVGAETEPAEVPPRPILREILSDRIASTGDEGPYFPLEVLPPGFRFEVNPIWPLRRIVNTIFERNLDGYVWQRVRQFLPEPQQLVETLSSKRAARAKQMLEDGSSQNISVPVLRQLFMTLPVPRRELLDDLIVAFSLDHFPAVARLYAGTMDTTAKLNLLFSIVEAKDIYRELAIDYPQHVAARSEIVEAGRVARPLFTWLQMADLNMLLEEDLERYLVTDALKGYRRGRKPHLDAILIAGNLIEHGYESRRRPVASFLADLCGLHGVSVSQLYVVPGDQDLSPERLPAWYNPHKVLPFPTERILRQNVSDPELTTLARSYLSDYLDFRERFGFEPHNDERNAPWRLWWRVQVKSRSEFPVWITGFNTALYGGTGKLWRGRINEHALRQALPEQKHSEQLTILLSHRPLNWSTHDAALPLLNRPLQIHVHGFSRRPELFESRGYPGDPIHLASGFSTARDNQEPRFIYQIASLMEAPDGSRFLRVWERASLGPRFQFDASLESKQDEIYRDYPIAAPRRYSEDAASLQLATRFTRRKGEQPVTQPTLPSLRNFLATAAGNESHFNDFVSEKFPDVYRRYSSGMDRLARMNLLYELVLPEEILAAYRQYNPEGSAYWTSLLRSR